MKMKRGQASVFVIIGICVLAAFLLIFFFRDKLIATLRQEPTNPQEYLNQQLKDIEKEIGRCVVQETDKAAILLMENGGEFNRTFGYIHYIKDYPILCREMNETTTCLSEPILISELQNKLNIYLPDKIRKCTNLEAFRGKDYTLTEGEMKVNTNFVEDSTVVGVSLPIELKRGAYISEQNNFIYTLNIPLGDLFRTVNDLVQIKAGGSRISVIQYNKVKFNKYFIEVRRPYPDEVYTIYLNSNPKYKCDFAIEGIGRFERPEGRVI